MELKNKNILITGGYGFIGVNLAVDLDKEGVNVIIPTTRQIPMSPFTTYICDVRDYNRLKEIVLKEDIHVVIHLANETSQHVKETQPKIYYSNNQQMLLNVLELGREQLVEHVIVTNPDETILNSYRNIKTPVIDLNINCSIFGANDINSGRLIPELMISAVKGTYPNIHPTEMTQRNWLYIKDLSNAIVCGMKMLDSKNKTIDIYHKNLRTPSEIKKLIEKIANKKINIKLKIQKTPRTKGKSNFKWEPKYEFEQALLETFGWYKHNYQEK